MTPEEAAVALLGEIEAALEAEEAAVRVVELAAPAKLGADMTFCLRLESNAGQTVHELPGGLALGYLADEEAAVDEFKWWLDRLLAEVGRRQQSGAADDL